MRRETNDRGGWERQQGPGSPPKAAARRGCKGGLLQGQAGPSRPCLRLREESLQQYLQGEATSSLRAHRAYRSVQWEISQRLQALLTEALSRRLL